MVVQTLPEKFLFFHADKCVSGASTIQVAEITATVAEGSKAYTVAVTPTEETYTLSSAYQADDAVCIGTFKLNGVGKRVYSYEITAKSSTGVTVPIYSFTQVAAVFGKYALRCKKSVSVPEHINVIQHTAPAPAPAKVIKNISAPSIPASPPAPLPPTPKPTAPKTTAAKNKGAGDLGLFVAKQLLEFAQSKHEMCPITAEEFITGNTAVMPCGHLFMQFAIEETFKKEPNKCPSCRQNGRPTYV